MKKMKTALLLAMIGMLSFSFANATDVTRQAGGSMETIQVTLWTFAVSSPTLFFSYSGSDQTQTSPNSSPTLIYFRTSTGADITPITGTSFSSISTDPLNPTIISKNFPGSGGTGGSTVIIRVWKIGTNVYFNANRFGVPQL